MAYEKKEWYSGETITASKLNHIEDGIDTLDKGSTSKIDTITSNLNSEIQTRTTETTTLKSRVDQIVAPTGEAPSAAEVTDARVGADGKTYDSVGNAIRTQVTDLKSEFHSSVCILRNPVIVPALMNKTFAEIYALFDAFVSRGIISKELVGYGSSANTSPDDAVEDATLPIYMYSLKSPARMLDTSTTNTTLLMSACIHGNEKTGIPVMLNFLKEYEQGDNRYVNGIVEKFNVDFIPCLNPWGVDAAVGTTISDVRNYVGRTNKRGVDLNRNGDFCWETVSAQAGTTNYKGQKADSECETKLIVQLASQSKYAYYIEFHGLLDNLLFQVHSIDTLTQKVGMNVINAMKARVNELGVDFDEYHRKPDGTYRNATQNFGRSPFPINEIVHKKTSPYHGAIVELQRYDSKEFYPAVSQQYESEFAITFISELCDRLVDTFTSGEFGSSSTLAKTNGNMLPMSPTSWVNGGLNADYQRSRGVPSRLRTIEPLAVGRGIPYEFGIAAGNESYVINLAYKTINMDKYKTYTFSDSNRIFVPSDDGVIYPIVAVSNKSSFVDAHSLRRAFVPYFKQAGISKSGLISSTTEGVNLVKDFSYINGNVVHMAFEISVAKTSWSQKKSLTIITLTYPPITRKAFLYSFGGTRSDDQDLRNYTGYASSNGAVKIDTSASIYSTYSPDTVSMYFDFSYISYALSVAEGDEVDPSIIPYIIDPEE